MKFEINHGFCFSLGDQLAIGKETGRRLGMGTNMYPSSALLGQDRDASTLDVPIDELIEKADGFAGVFPGTSLLMLIFGFGTNFYCRNAPSLNSYLICFGRRHFSDTCQTPLNDVKLKKLSNPFSL